MQIKEAQMGPEWQWFMAVNAKGNWLTLEGIAFISLDQGLVSGSLFFDLESFRERKNYASFAGTVDENGELITLEIKSHDQAVPAFTVSGQAYMGSQDGYLAKTMILTDGTTVLGFSRFEKTAEEIKGEHQQGQV
jgi:hypothetical protein